MTMKEVKILTNLEKYLLDLQATKKPIMCKVFELRAERNEFCCKHNCQLCNIESLLWLQDETD